MKMLDKVFEYTKHNELFLYRSKQQQITWETEKRKIQS